MGRGITLKSGINPANAIENLFAVQPAGDEFGAECFGALQMVWYKAILETFEECDAANGRSRFNTKFATIKIEGTSSTYPPYVSYQTYPEYIFGDWRYVSNPDFDPATPQWQGENAIQMTNSDADNANFYGHPIGVETLANIKAFLDAHRRAGATQNASLDDDAKRLKTLKLMEYLFQ